MFGYVVANIGDLDEREKTRYTNAYCGLCRVLGERCGQRCRPILAYDTTFLALLYGSLYEPRETSGQARCLFHPVKERGFSYNKYTNYAADITVALAYHKCLDNWQDDHSIASRGYASLLQKPYNAVKGRMPDKCAVIERQLAAITELEKSGAPAPDALADRFGMVMGEILVCEHDIWEDTLREFGTWLGKFIYLMDAVCDYDDDMKHGDYNPLCGLEAKPEDMEPTLAHMIGSAARAFEKLPIEQDVHLLRSVLYSGVWQQFNAKYKADEIKAAKGTAGPRGAAGANDANGGVADSRAAADAVRAAA
ncbi:MAG: DUF5685 family protein [Coriobacteriales bacterium]|jgi:hypothetical protein|nr:DUF5685 family protein [Coriobacteriales bacterium]